MIAPAATSRLDRIRAFLSSDMRTLRWVLLGLYITVILALIGAAAFESLDSAFAAMILLGITIAAQAMFIFGAGTIQLCRPIKRRRLWMPVLASSLAFAVLIAGICSAMAELFKLDTGPQSDLYGMIFFAFLILSWIAWGVLIFTYARKWHRYRVLSSLSSMLFAGSLLELLATVPSHVIVTRRPGCLVGIGTMIGIIAGLNVMIFSFGPMIVVLFLRPRYRDEMAKGNQFCEGCGYDLRASVDRCPECGMAFKRNVAKLELNPNTP